LYVKALIISSAADLRQNGRDHANSPTFSFTAEAQKALGIEGCTGVVVNGTAAADGAGTSSPGQTSRTLHLAGTGYWTQRPYPYLTGLKSGSRMVAESLGTLRRPRNFPRDSAGFRGRLFGRPRPVRHGVLGAALQTFFAEGCR
jgi:hypothetical protein